MSGPGDLAAAIINVMWAADNAGYLPMCVARWRLPRRAPMILR